MEKGDKGSTLIRMGVSGWMFLLVPAYPCCPGSKAVKRSLLLLLFTAIVISWSQPYFTADFRACDRVWQTVIRNACNVLPTDWSTTHARELLQSSLSVKVVKVSTSVIWSFPLSFSESIFWLVYRQYWVPRNFTSIFANFSHLLSCKL